MYMNKSSPREADEITVRRKEAGKITGIHTEEAEGKEGKKKQRLANEHSATKG